MTTFYESDTITPVSQFHLTMQEAKQEEGHEIKNKYISFLLFFGVALFFIFIGYFSSSDVMLIVGAVFTLLLILNFIQTLIQRRVALMMNTKIIPRHKNYLK